MAEPSEAVATQRADSSAEAVRGAAAVEQELGEIRTRIVDLMKQGLVATTKKERHACMDATSEFLRRHGEVLGGYLAEQATDEALPDSQAETEWLATDHPDSGWSPDVGVPVPPREQLAALTESREAAEHQEMPWDSPQWEYARRLIEAASRYYKLAPGELLPHKKDAASSDCRDLLDSILRETTELTPIQRSVILGYRSIRPEYFGRNLFTPEEGSPGWQNLTHSLRYVDRADRGSERLRADMAGIFDELDRTVTPRLEFSQPTKLSDTTKRAIYDWARSE